MDIWQRLVARDMPHGHLELRNRAADEIARLRGATAGKKQNYTCAGWRGPLPGKSRSSVLQTEIASLTAEVMHLRGKLDHIAQCARWDLEPCAWPREHGKTGSSSNDTVIISETT